jgi:aminopeptidase N
MVFEDVTGSDLSWFFDEWYFKAGHPKLNINYNFDMVKREEKIVIDQTQTEPSLLVFKFPLKVDVYENGSIHSYKIFVDKRHQEFIINCDSKPDWVNVDADKTLLCEKNDNKKLPEFLYQYHHAKNFRDQLEALQYVSMLQSENTSAKELLIVALRSPISNLRKFAVENIYTDDSFSVAIASPMLQELALTDKDATIRASALRKLSSSKHASTYYSTFQKATSDSSYTVSAEALKALANTSPEIALNVCKTFEGEKNIQIQKALVKIYADKGTIENYPFFLKLLKENRGTALYSVLNDFGNYLYRMPDPMVEKGTLLLNNIAQNDEEWQVRYAAYEAIKHFKSKYNPDIEKDRITVINSVLTEIRLKEKNKQLIEIYAHEK